jgi:ubiquinol-cytochrome c reductase cytochrome b subunit
LPFVARAPDRDASRRAAADRARTIPDGIEIKNSRGADGKPVDGIPFHPYYTVKDIVGVGVFLTVFCDRRCSSCRTFGGLFLERAELRTGEPAVDARAHRAGVVLHAVLRDVARRARSTRWARCCSCWLSIVVFFFLPWLDRSPVKSIRYKGLLSKLFLAAFVIAFVVLVTLGMAPADGLYVLFARIFTVVYFAFFLLMPWYTRIERPARAAEGHVPCVSRCRNL